MLKLKSLEIGKNIKETLRKESNCLIKYIINWFCLLKKEKKDKNLNTNEFGYVHWIS